MKFNKLYFKKYKDQFNYYHLIKNINPNYRLYFNSKDKLFAIVNLNNNYEICKVFSEFSGNLLDNLRFFNVVNFNKILTFIDNENEILSKKHMSKLSEKQLLSLSEIKKLSNRSTYINQTDINKIIGASRC